MCLCKKLLISLLISLAVLFAGGCGYPAEQHPDYAPFIEEDASIRYFEYGDDLANVDFNKARSYNLWRNAEYLPYAGGQKSVPTITAYLVESNSPVGCVIISPGGGYAMRSNAEGETVAEYINENLGMSVFVVNYRVAPNNYKAILSDELRAIRFVRFYADDFNIDPDHVAVLGFSAGGHLALMAGEHYDYGKSGDNIDAMSSRPDAVALCYPVVSLSSEYTHEESRTNFLGEDDTQENRTRFSGEFAVRADMPPVFLMHCKDDDVVSIENSYALAAALEENGISCTSFWYEEGGHGFGIGEDLAESNAWLQELRAWLAELGFPERKTVD